SRADQLSVVGLPGSSVLGIGAIERIGAATSTAPLRDSMVVSSGVGSAVGVWNVRATSPSVVELPSLSGTSVFLGTSSPSTVVGLVLCGWTTRYQRPLCSRSQACFRETVCTPCRPATPPTLILADGSSPSASPRPTSTSLPVTGNLCPTPTTNRLCI